MVMQIRLLSKCHQMPPTHSSVEIFFITCKGVKPCGSDHRECIARQFVNADDVWRSGSNNKHSQSTKSQRLSTKFTLGLTHDWATPSDLARI
eukprot:scaffold90001_cov41-Tisochrysis_lutea.AAC.3